MTQGPIQHIQEVALQKRFEQKHHIETEGRRWIILFGYSILAFCTAMVWATQSLIIDDTKQYFGIGETAYLQFFNVFLYGNLISLIPFSYFMADHFAACLIISSVMTTIGGIMRYVAGTNYVVAIIGQFIVGLSQGSVTSAPAVISERWFASHEGSWALLIGTYSLYLGWIFGNISPCIYIAKYVDIPVKKNYFAATTHLTNMQQKYFERMYFDQMIICILPTLILAFSLRNKPTHFPNVGAMIKADTPQQSLGKLLKILLSNGRLMKNTMCIGFGKFFKNYIDYIFTIPQAIGFSYTVTSVTSDILEPRNYSTTQLSNIATAFLVPGILAAIAGTLYLEIKQTKSYDFMLKLFFIAGFVGTLGLAIAGANADFWLVLLLNACVGLGYIAFVPFAYESLIETSFPQPEGLVLALPLVAAQIFSYILNLLTTMSAVGEQGYWVLAVSALLAMIYMLFDYNTVFNKSESELEREKEDVSPDVQPFLKIVEEAV